MITKFSPEVSEEIKFYVYRLIDPRNGHTFYIGKGKGNRIFDHMNGIVKREDEMSEGIEESQEDEDSQKISTIREIQNNGLEVIHVIHRHGLEEDVALEVEAALIEVYPGISNVASGRGSNERGVMNVQQIETTYKREVLEEIEDKCIMIKITNYHLDRCNMDIYETTRVSWRLNKQRAEKAEYVLSVLNGVIVAVYKPSTWSINPNHGTRLEFFGEEASDDIKAKYIGKRIPEKFRKKGMASPCLYVNC